MKSLMPVRKIIKIVSKHRNPRHDRRSSLQDCFDSATGLRRCSRCNPWVILFILLSAVIYLYSHRAHYLPALNGNIFINQLRVDTPPHEKIKSKQEVTVRPFNAPQLAKPSKGNTRETTAGSNKKASGDFYKTEILNSGPSLLPRKHPATDLPLCFRKKPYPKFELMMKSVELTQENVYPPVSKGGAYHPADCKARFKVGIIVPYRDRISNLGTFLYNIHPFLMRQKLDYQIFVVEQFGNDLFNKGRVMNAGYNEMMKFNKFHCVIFHDLDLLPMHENILYNCPTLPRHMCARVNDTAMKKYDKSYKFQNLFGGVISMTREQFERANGFSNLYYGWGGEDNDLFYRLNAAGYPMVRYNSTVGVYFVLPHQRERVNHFRNHLLSRAVERYKIDGLSNNGYYVVSTTFRPLCTHIVVDINPRKDNITDLIQKWSKPGYKFH